MSHVPADMASPGTTEFAPERIVRTRGVDLCAQSIGNPADPAILLIAGAASSMLHWADEFCTRLAAGSRFVIRYDHRDTGRSVSYPPGSPPYTGRDLDEDAIGVLDAFGVGTAHIVGMSMGAGIGQSLAIRRPDRVASLTLIATSPIAREPGGPDLPPPSEEVAAEFGGVSPPDWSDRDAVIDYLVGQELLCTSKSRPVPEEFVRDLATRTVDRAVSIASINNHFLVAAGDDSAPETLAGITAPTLVVHGTEDPAFPAAHGAALADAIPGARLLTLERTGHELPPAVWDTVVPAILRLSEPR
jgi:pimeloyl-ACP methyl ester carboxylesterase